MGYARHAELNAIAITDSDDAPYHVCARGPDVLVDGVEVVQLSAMGALPERRRAARCQSWAMSQPASPASSAVLDVRNIPGPAVQP
jgi:hypothetical protein